MDGGHASKYTFGERTGRPAPAYEHPLLAPESATESRIASVSR